MAGSSNTLFRRRLSGEGYGLLLVLLLLVCCASPSYAQQDCITGHGLSAAQLANFDLDKHFEQLSLAAGKQAHKPMLVGGNLSLGEVQFIRQNVFPKSSHLLARQANRFNIVTSEQALRAAFPFDVGAPIDETRRREAERVLRNKSYLYDAAVLVRQICGNRVDLDVVVRDVWTLTPSFVVKRSGGDTETRAVLADLNIFGTGKNLSLEYFDDKDRSGAAVRYDDPNLFGSRWRGGIVAADNTDGERYRLRVSRPYFALDTPYALGFSVNHFVREQDLEFLGRDVFELQADSDTADVFVSRSTGRRAGWVNRYFAGARYVDETFDFPTNFPGATQTTRTFAYPYVGWQLLEDKFVERTDVDRVGITEDIKLGWSSYAEIGWSTDQFGGDGDFVLARLVADYRRYIGGVHLLSLAGNFTGRFDLDRHISEDLELEARASYLWQQAPKWRFFASADYRQTRRLSLDKQLTLGGDNGLRGYPNRYQTGDRSFAITIEQRYYSGFSPFGLLRVGYAAFVDYGRAWFADTPPAWVPDRRGDHFGNLSNVGIGLRFESIRTRRDRIVHVDIAKPLVDGPFVDSWEFTIIAKRAI